MGPGGFTLNRAFFVGLAGGLEGSSAGAPKESGQGG